MALQNVRGIRWLQQDLSYGSGAARDVTLYQTVPAAGRPMLSTIGFKASIPATMIAAVPIAASGLIRMVVSKSPGYWMTLTGTVNGVAVTLPIPPLATVFLPAGFVGTTMAMNSLSAPSGAPVAGTDVRLTFDFLQEA